MECQRRARGRGSKEWWSRNEELIMAHQAAVGEGKWWRAPTCKSIAAREFSVIKRRHRDGQWTRRTGLTSEVYFTSFKPLLRNFKSLLRVYHTSVWRYWRIALWRL